MEKKPVSGRGVLDGSGMCRLSHTYACLLLWWTSWASSAKSLDQIQ